MECLQPLRLKDESGHDRFVPCGKCNACLVRQRSEWTYRLQQEMKVNPVAYFVTLTYSPEEVPICTVHDYQTGMDLYSMNVSKHDVQKWLKRLRKVLAPKDIKLRYYLISEYGPVTFRPHYHAIVFLSKFLNLEHFRSLLADTWLESRTSADVVTEERIKYVTEYCLTRKDIPSYLEPNFRLMSRNPGIGVSYVDTYRRWHLAAPEQRFWCPDYLGNRSNMPRYYREKIFPDDIREEHSAEMEHRAMSRLIARSQIPGDSAGRLRIEAARKEDYIRKTNFFLNKKSRKKI